MFWTIDRIISFAVLVPLFLYAFFQSDRQPQTRIEVTIALIIGSTIGLLLK